MSRFGRQRSIDTNEGRRHRPDYLLVVIAAALMVVGLIVIFAISPGLSEQQGVGQGFFVSKQLIAIGVGALTFLVTSRVPRSVWKKLTKPLIFGAILVTIIALILPVTPDYPAHRWIRLGGFSLQAVEVLKFAALVGFSYFFAHRMKQGRIGSTSETFKPLLILLGVIGVVVAVLQSDLGSAAVLMAMIGGMAFVAGLPMTRVALVVAVVAIAGLLAISASDYRRERFVSYLNPQSDCQDEGYQACQALIAIGSGGLTGKGFGGGVAGYGYVPESANDSIFAVYSEMFGFVGVAMLLGLFVALFSRLKHIMERAPDEQSRLLVAGVLAWLGFQSIINIGAMAGLLPLKGITLPLVSYGGTSILFVSAALGMVFQISRYTSFTVSETPERGAHAYSAYGRRQRGAHNAPVSRRA
ncbi:MAG: FtsW/RodA/SpoVE family cell cycle protein [Candidatus Saccharibacteria bacterium]|nr:FtsW/RodA/SpoVE family cell cycle protein [Candidatus Saccharibacteria bacterium]